MTTRFSTALVPVDFSERSPAALRAAAGLVGAEGVVHAVHVLRPLIPNEPGVIWGTVDDESRIAHATEALSELLAKHGLDGARAHVRVASGNPAYGVGQVAEDLAVDVIVVPAAGKSGLAALGSVAERIVRVARRPVLVLHDKE